MRVLVIQKVVQLLCKGYCGERPAHFPARVQYLAVTMFCSKCGKKETRNRTINESSKICSDCEPVANASNDQQTADAAALIPSPVPGYMMWCDDTSDGGIV